MDAYVSGLFVGTNCSKTTVQRSVQGA